MKDLEHALKTAKRMRFAAEQRRDQALSESLDCAVKTVS